VGAVRCGSQGQGGHEVEAGERQDRLGGIYINAGHRAKTLRLFLVKSGGGLAFNQFLGIHTLKLGKGQLKSELPVLGSKTPRKAVKTADDLEMVEALLLDAERRAGLQGGREEAELEAIAWVRSALGLQK
jgi:hypothetical protein